MEEIVSVALANAHRMDTPFSIDLDAFRALPTSHGATGGAGGAAEESEAVSTSSGGDGDVATKPADARVAACVKRRMHTPCVTCGAPTTLLSLCHSARFMTSREREDPDTPLPPQSWTSCAACRLAKQLSRRSLDADREDDAARDVDMGRARVVEGVRKAVRAANCRSRYRRAPSSLGVDEALALFTGACGHCGRGVAFDAPNTEDRPSIDRVEALPHLGYAGNMAWLCWGCNREKGSDDYVRQLEARIRQLLQRVDELERVMDT